MTNIKEQEGFGILRARGGSSRKVIGENDRGGYSPRTRR